MKYIFFLLILSAIPGFGQDSGNYESKLEAVFKKIGFYDSQKQTNDSAYDSIEKYNEAFEDLLLEYTRTETATINNSFQTLADAGLNISTSDDGLFRIYSWDDEMGGTMRGFRNVVQIKAGGKVKSEAVPVPDDTSEEYNFTYEILGDVSSQGKTYYVVKCVSVMSSAVSVHQIKIFSIDNGRLNDQAVLIKTKTGIRNALQYDVDLSAEVNRDLDPIESAWMVYDKKNKIISIPLITEEGKITKKRIKYQFKGIYFERI
jgi:hypothetical protein